MTWWPSSPPHPATARPTRSPWRTWWWRIPSTSPTSPGFTHFPTAHPSATPTGWPSGYPALSRYPSGFPQSTGFPSSASYPTAAPDPACSLGITVSWSGNVTYTRDNVKQVNGRETYWWKEHAFIFYCPQAGDWRQREAERYDDWDHAGSVVGMCASAWYGFRFSEYPTNPTAEMYGASNQQVANTATCAPACTQNGLHLFESSCICGGAGGGGADDGSKVCHSGQTCLATGRCVDSTNFQIVGLEGQIQQQETQLSPAQVLGRLTGGVFRRDNCKVIGGSESYWIHDEYSHGALPGLPFTEPVIYLYRCPLNGYWALSSERNWQEQGLTTCSSIFRSQVGGFEPSLRDAGAWQTLGGQTVNPPDPSYWYTLFRSNDPSLWAPPECPPPGSWHPTGYPSTLFPTGAPSATTAPTPSVTAPPTNFPHTSSEGSCGWLTRSPSASPTGFPTHVGQTGFPTNTGSPSKQPSASAPSMAPETAAPSAAPTRTPSRSPTGFPAPTGFPSTGFPSSGFPSSGFPSTGFPSTAFPTNTRSPTRPGDPVQTGFPRHSTGYPVTGFPSAAPTDFPTAPTTWPTAAPSRQPTGFPSAHPARPTGSPTESPTGWPTSVVVWRDQCSHGSTLALSNTGFWWMDGLYVRRDDRPINGWETFWMVDSSLVIYYCPYCGAWAVGSWNASDSAGSNASLSACRSVYAHTYEPYPNTWQSGDGWWLWHQGSLLHRITAHGRCEDTCSATNGSLPATAHNRLTGCACPGAPTLCRGKQSCDAAGASCSNCSVIQVHDFGSTMPGVLEPGFNGDYRRSDCRLVDGRETYWHVQNDHYLFYCASMGEWQFQRQWDHPWHLQGNGSCTGVVRSQGVRNGAGPIGIFMWYDYAIRTRVAHIGDFSTHWSMSCVDEGDPGVEPCPARAAPTTCQDDPGGGVLISGLSMWQVNGLYRSSSVLINGHKTYWLHAGRWVLYGCEHKGFLRWAIGSVEWYGNATHPDPYAKFAACEFYAYATEFPTAPTASWFTQNWQSVKLVLNNVTVWESTYYGSDVIAQQNGTGACAGACSDAEASSSYPCTCGSGAVCVTAQDCDAASSRCSNCTEVLVSGLDAAILRADRSQPNRHVDGLYKRDDCKLIGGRESYWRTSGAGKWYIYHCSLYKLWAIVDGTHHDWRDQNRGDCVRYAWTRAPADGSDAAPQPVGLTEWAFWSGLGHIAIESDDWYSIFSCPATNYTPPGCGTASPSAAADRGVSLVDCAQSSSAFSFLDSAPGGAAYDRFLSAAAAGSRWLLATGPAGAVHCSGDGSGGPSSAGCYGAGMLGCTYVVRDIAPTADASAIYAACGDAVTRCLWSTANKTASACAVVAGASCPAGGGTAEGVALDGAKLLLSCSDTGILVCPLSASGSGSLSGPCVQKGVDPCASLGGRGFNLAVSLDTPGMLTVGCDRNGYAHCSWDSAAGAAGCSSTRLGPSPCPTYTKAITQTAAGVTAVSCSVGGYYICGRGPTAAPAATPGRRSRAAEAAPAPRPSRAADALQTAPVPGGQETLLCSYHWRGSAFYSTKANGVWFYLVGRDGRCLLSGPQRQLAAMDPLVEDSAAVILNINSAPQRVSGAAVSCAFGVAKMIFWQDSDIWVRGCLDFSGEWLLPDSRRIRLATATQNCSALASAHAESCPVTSQIAHDPGTENWVDFERSLVPPDGQISSQVQYAVMSVSTPSGTEADIPQVGLAQAEGKELRFNNEVWRRLTEFVRVNTPDDPAHAGTAEPTEQPLCPQFRAMNGFFDSRTRKTWHYRVSYNGACRFFDSETAPTQAVTLRRGLGGDSKVVQVTPAGLETPGVMLPSAVFHWGDESMWLRGCYDFTGEWRLGDGRRVSISRHPSLPCRFSVTVIYRPAAPTGSPIILAHAFNNATVQAVGNLLRLDLRDDPAAPCPGCCTHDYWCTGEVKGGGSTIDFTEGIWQKVIRCGEEHRAPVFHGRWWTPVLCTDPGVTLFSISTCGRTDGVLDSLIQEPCWSDNWWDDPERDQARFDQCRSLGTGHLQRALCSRHVSSVGDQCFSVKVGSGSYNREWGTAYVSVQCVTPTEAPTGFPTGFPKRKQTGFPTGFPKRTGYPTRTGFPSRSPTGFPSRFPSGFPSRSPSGFPTGFPKRLPGGTGFPSRRPTGASAEGATGFPSKPPAPPTDFPSSSGG